ncbi:hypothetical protein GCM10023211_08710 [Orbus sasakiae]|uniref:Uncharacterized protein n=1 Tax=Orbus sasakiae TaxID=1078475 RepID=A0ABP9N2F7_9GAMM
MESYNDLTQDRRIAICCLNNLRNEAGVNKYFLDLSLDQMRTIIICALNKPNAQCNYASLKMNLISLTNTRILDWIKTDKNACYYLYLRMRMVSDINLLMSQMTSTFPINHERRYELILSVLDAFNTAYKINYEYYIVKQREEWLTTIQEKNPFIWLKKIDEETAKYILEDHMKKIPNYCKEESLLNRFFDIKPQTHEERCLAIIAIFNSWEVPSDTKKLFLLNLKRSISIINFRKRQKKNHRIAFQTYISQTTKNKLKELAHSKELPINSYLESLIDRIYSERKTK